MLRGFGTTWEANYQHDKFNNQTSQISLQTKKT